MIILIKGANQTFGSLHPELPKTQEGEYTFESSELSLEFDESTRKLPHRVLDIRKGCAITGIEKDLAEGEQITEQRFGILKQQYKDLPVGTPVLDIKTNQRELFVIFDELLLNEEGMLIQSGSGDLSVEEKPILGGAVLLFFVEQFASVLAKEVANRLFEDYFPPSSDEQIKAEIRKIKDQVRQIITESKYDRLEETLISTRGWLRDTYSTKLKSISENGISSVEWQKVIDALESHQLDLKEVIDIVDIKISDSDLSDCDYLTRTKVALYTACSCLRIAIFKEEISLRNKAISAGLVTYETKAQESELKTFIDAAHQKVIHFQDRLSNGRKDKLHYSGYTVQKVPFYGAAGEIRGYADIRKVSWRDKFSSDHKDDPFKQSAKDKVYRVETNEKDLKDQKTKANNAFKAHETNINNLVTNYITNPYDKTIKHLSSCTPLFNN